MIVFFLAGKHHFTDYDENSSANCDGNDKEMLKFSVVCLHSVLVEGAKLYDE